eukprot:3035311-Amphidinium_carterae.1
MESSCTCVGRNTLLVAAGMPVIASASRKQFTKPSNKHCHTESRVLRAIQWYYGRENPSRPQNKYHRSLAFLNHSVVSEYVRCACALFCEMIPPHNGRLGQGLGNSIGNGCVKLMYNNSRSIMWKLVRE